VLVTSTLRDSVWLALVLGYVGVDKVDQVRANGGAQNSGQLGRLFRFGTVEVEDANRWASKLREYKDGGMDG
jgi:hypothetical protein